MDNIKVRKRDDNTLQDWDRSKVTTSVTNAGVPAAEAEHLTTLVESWVRRTTANGEVKSAHIRGLVIELLKLLHPEVAISFQDYSKLPD